MFRRTKYTVSLGGRRGGLQSVNQWREQNSGGASCACADACSLLRSGVAVAVDAGATGQLIACCRT